MASLTAPLAKAARRLAPLAIAPSHTGAPGNTEIERLWLNASTVKWSYTPYTNGKKGGAIEKGWNIQTGAATA